MTPATSVPFPRIYLPFAVLYMGQPVELGFLWAGLCLLGAVYFIFRG